MNIIPTPFFIREESTLKQRFDLRLDSLPEGGEIGVRSSSGETRHSAAASIYLSELPEPGELEFTLLDPSGRVLDQQTLSWSPARHWTIYVNPASHHDLGYTDLPSNVLREHDKFLDQVIGFCERTEHWPPEAQYHYTIEQAWSALHFLARRAPAQVERLARQIQAGRIEVTALFGNEISELCGSEELVRLLYPAMRMQRRLGIPIQTAELNDIPGFTWGLASALAGAGIRWFGPNIPDYFRWGERKPFIWDEQEVLPRDLPGAFWWEGPEGERVLLWYEGPGLGWSGMWTLEQVERELGGCLADLAARGYPFDLLRARVQGGSRDNSPPDLRFSCIVRDWNARWAYPKLVLSTGAEFFTEFEKRASGQLKVLRGDLPGTDYPLGATSTPAATAVNRQTHASLSAAERLATIAALLTDLPYPADQIAEAYDQMLLYAEHTWGMAHPTGPAQEAAWAQKSQLAYRAAALAHAVLSRSANRLADGVALDGDEYAVVVFNPLAHTRTDIAVIEALPTAPAGKPMFWQPGEHGEPDQWVWGSAVGRHLVTLPAALLEQPFKLIDLSTGQPVPCQVSSLTDPLYARPFAPQRYALRHTGQDSHPLLNYDPAQSRLLFFLAEDIPALGYKTYVLRPGQGQPAVQPERRAGPDCLENRYYRVKVNPTTGAVTSIYDKELGRELVDLWAPHGFNQVIARDVRTGEVTSARRSTIVSDESGPVFSRLVVRGDAPGCPQRTQEIRLYEGVKRIDFATRLLRDATPLLEVLLSFPFQVEHPEWLYEGSGGAQRPVTDQLPGTNTHANAVQHWVSISSPEVAITWASLDAPAAAFGKLWPSPISQAHRGRAPKESAVPFARDPAALAPGHLYAYLNVSNFRTNFQPSQAGDLLFRFSLTSSAVADPAAAGNFGWAQAMPLVGANVKGPQSGSLPPSQSLISLDPPTVTLLALKAAEDGDGLILRLVETEGKETECAVRLPFVEIERAWRTDLVERNQEELKVRDQTLRVAIQPRAMYTIRLKGQKTSFPVAEEWWYE